MLIQNERFHQDQYRLFIGALFYAKLNSTKK